MIFKSSLCFIKYSPVKLKVITFLNAMIGTLNLFEAPQQFDIKVDFPLAGRGSLLLGSVYICPSLCPVCESAVGIV